MFDDSFRLRPYHAGAILAVVGFGLVQRYAASPETVFGLDAGAGKKIYTVIPQILSLGFVVLALAQVQIGR